MNSEILQLGLMVGENVVEKVIVMFILMAIGFFLAKRRILTDEGKKQMTELLLTVVVPCVIITSYQREFNEAIFKNLMIAFLMGVLMHFVLIILGMIFFKHREDGRDRINKFAITYSNCGFMGLPLIQSIYGDDGVFYAIAYIAVFNILYWTHGVYVFTKDFKMLSVKNLLKTPAIIGTVLGLLFFFARIRLPVVLNEAMSFVAALNTPIPMIILGTYLVELNLKETIKNSSMWIICTLRLLVAPIIAVFIAGLLGADEVVAMSSVLCSACPVAAVSTLFAVRYNQDSKYASELVSASTLFTVVTIPIAMIIAVIIYNMFL